MKLNVGTAWHQSLRVKSTIQGPSRMAKSTRFAMQEQRERKEEELRRKREEAFWIDDCGLMRGWTLIELLHSILSVFPKQRSSHFEGFYMRMRQNDGMNGFQSDMFGLGGEGRSALGKRASRNRGQFNSARSTSVFSSFTSRYTNLIKFTHRCTEEEHK